MSVHERVDPGYLEKAIASILAQTFDDFEFTIIADGQLNSCQQGILKRYAAADARLTILQNDHQMGLAYSMNLGISLSKSDYFARMDADDVSLCERLQKQILFLENHKDIEIVGTFAYEIDDADRIVFRKRLPVGPEHLSMFLAKRDPFIHPTVVFRRGFFEKVGLYNPDVSVFEDTELWCRAFRMGVQGANISEYLYKFRVNNDFYNRRRGLSYALQEFRLRWNFLKDSGFPTHYYAYPLLIFSARLAPRFALKTLYRLAR